jgi:hypothetical protein
LKPPGALGPVRLPLPPTPPTFTYKISPGKAGTVENTDAPSPPVLTVSVDPPAAPIAVMVTDVTPDGTTHGCSLPVKVKTTLGSPAWCAETQACAGTLPKARAAIPARTAAGAATPASRAVLIAMDLAFLSSLKSLCDPDKQGLPGSRLLLAVELSGASVSVRASIICWI